MSNTTYLMTDHPLTDPNHIPADLIDGAADGAEIALRFHVYYARDARRRGFKLSLNRISKGGNFITCLPFSKYNGLIHLADAARKNDKEGKAWAARVEKAQAAITSIALASEDPVWQDVFAALEAEAA